MKRGDEEKRLRGIAKEILDFLGFSNTEVAVNLVSSRAMRSLNRKFRGEDFTTNVLSFATPSIFPSHKGFPRLLGEVYLDPTYVRDRGEDMEYLLIHGVLHLLGFDHARFSDRMRMNQLEKEILKWQRTKS